MKQTLLIILTLIATIYVSFAAPLVGVTNGSRVTFFDSETPDTLDRFGGDNTNSNEYLSGYQVFDDQGHIIGNLTDITVGPDGSFYGMTQNGDFYKFSDFGRYQNNQLGFKMQLLHSNLPKGSVDFVNQNTIGILSNNKLSYYETTNFTLVSQENLQSNQYAGLAFDNNVAYSIKFSPSPSNLAEVNGNSLIFVPNGNAQSDIAGDMNLFYLNVNGQILTYDGNNVVNKGNQAIVLQSIDRIVPEPTLITFLGLSAGILLFRRNRH